MKKKKTLKERLQNSIKEVKEKVYVDFLGIEKRIHTNVYCCLDKYATAFKTSHDLLMVSIFVRNKSIYIALMQGNVVLKKLSVQELVHLFVSENENKLFNVEPKVRKGMLDFNEHLASSHRLPADELIFHIASTTEKKASLTMYHLQKKQGEVPLKELIGFFR